MRRRKGITGSLKALYCDHRGTHTCWGYERGTGVVTLYCSKCDKSILKVPLDDMDDAFILKIKEDINKPDYGTDPGEDSE